MGAEQFSDFSNETDVQKAFRNLRDQAAYDYGHSGYTGTIAEKDAFVIFTPPAGVDHVEALNALEESYYGAPTWADDHFHMVAREYNDKWGAAVAIKAPDGWYFCGWASC